MRIPKRPTLLAGTILPFACGSLTEPVCACSPAGGGTAVLTGLVTGPGAAPVVGATVRMRVLQDVTCAEVPATVGSSVQTGAAGRFRMPASWSGGRKCFQLWAEPPQGSTLAPSDSPTVRVDFLNTVRPDSVELPLRLR